MSYLSQERAETAERLKEALNTLGRLEWAYQQKTNAAIARAEQAERVLLRLRDALEDIASCYEGTSAGNIARAALAPTEEAP